MYSIFTKIIKGDIPAHTIYEDDKTLAFLDIHPAQRGHTLIIPKAQVDRLEELSEEDYDALMTTVKKVMRRLTSFFGKDYRACLKVEGFDVPHCHIHVIPCRNAADFWTKQSMDTEPDHAALRSLAQELFFT
jgi:histidine triad (HIT) family protein